jgi:glycosyltransferase involved in cell wall biosynthesis
MNYAVSVIVPVYNVEKYLAQCLASLVAQTLTSIEIIVVNDGSPDNAQAIIDEYQKQYPDKIFPFQKLNGGLGDARNFGISKARGQYIGFIDSDDWVEPSMFETLYQKAVQENSDLVLCDFEYVWENEQVSKRIPGYSLKLDKPMEKAVFLAPLFAWNKLYHHSFFSEAKLRFPRVLWYEDIPVSLPVFANARKITYVAENFVHYRQRTSSIMASNNTSKLQDIFVILEMLRAYFSGNGMLETYRDEIEYIHIEHLLLYGGFRFFRSKQSKELFSRALDEVNRNFSTWRKNPYIATLKPSYRIYLRWIQKWMIPVIHMMINLKRRS